MGITMTDLVALAVAMVMGSVLVFGTPALWVARVNVVESLLPLVGVLLIGAVITSVGTASMSGPGVPRPTYGRLVTIVLGTFVITAATSFLIRDLPYSIRFVSAVFPIWAILGILHRYVRLQRPWTERFVVVSSEKQLVDELAESPHVEIEQIIDPKTEADLGPLPAGCGLAVDLRAVMSERVAQYISSCDLAGFNVRALASVYQEHLGRTPLVHLRDGWEVSTPLLTATPWLPGKRLVETLLVLATAPLWVAVSILVWLFLRLSSSGPAIFKQRRIGLVGQPFVMYKFRTMRLDAEDLGPRFATHDDIRLIRGARFLRTTRLDEIPQLFNVLKGDMSLVGPRAEQVPFVRQFRKRIPFYDLRHLVRPGVTGWAQVNYGYADDAAETIEKLSYDLYYIQKMSPVLDLQILWRSLWTVLTRAGAR